MATAANQVYHHAITHQFPSEVFVSVVSLRDIVQGVGITDTAEDVEKQFISKLQEHLQNKR